MGFLMEAGAGEGAAAEGAATEGVAADSAVEATGGAGVANSGGKIKDVGAGTSLAQSNPGAAAYGQNIGGKPNITGITGPTSAYTGSSIPGSSPGMASGANLPSTTYKPGAFDPQYDQNLISGADKKALGYDPSKGGVSDTLKEIKGYAPGHAAPGINMPQLQPVGGQQQPQGGQDQQYQELMDYLNKQKGGM